MRFSLSAIFLGALLVGLSDFTSLRAPWRLGAESLESGGFVSEEELDEIMLERERVLKSLEKKFDLKSEASNGVETEKKNAQPASAQRERLGAGDESGNLSAGANGLVSPQKIEQKNIENLPAETSPKADESRTEQGNFAEKTPNDNQGVSLGQNSNATPLSAAQKAADVVLKERQKKREYFDENVRAALLDDIEKAQKKREWKPDLPEVHDFYQSVVPSGNIRVYSTNYDVRNLGTRVSEYVDEVLSAVLGSGIRLAHPLEIHMLLESEAKFDGNFLEVVGGVNNRLSVKANKNLNLEEFIRRTISLCLKSYAFSLGGEEAFKDVPHWLELAVGARVAQRISSGITFEMARYAAENPPETLDKVLAYKPSPDGVVNKFQESSAYWNLLALGVAYQDSLGGLISEILKSPAKRGAILESIKAKNGGKNFDLHWRSYLLGEIYGRLGGVKGLKDSDDEILRLTILLRQRQGEALEPIFDEKIFEYAPFSKSEIKSRLLEIKLALPWVNPVYYNSLVALGKMYQAALDGDREAFGANRTDFLNEFKNAREISKRALELLK